MQADPRTAHALELLQAQHLAPELTERRLQRMAGVLSRRLASITVVMENLYDPHNVSAVVRTSEGLGLDTLHVVEIPNAYSRSKSIVQGSDRWVEIERHKKLTTCLGDLMADGYTLCAADVGPGCIPLSEIPVDSKVAIVMGSERDGLSRRAKSLCDIRYTIPMTGFVQSFNVSVSAAISLFDLTRRRREHIDPELGDLDDDALKMRAARWVDQSSPSARRRRRMASRTEN
jgi:tRNA (guanosine-2'-O-)-methyltransferase